MSLHSASGCFLCDEVRKEGTLSSRLAIHNLDHRSISLESDNFLVLPDINPIIPGHSLLITKKHYFCFAQISDAMLTELQDIQSRAVSLVTEEFCSPFLFEHGSTTPHSRSGVCIQHAHIHLLPVMAPVDAWLQPIGKITRCKDVFTYTRSLGSDLRDYLAYEDQTRQGYLVSDLAQPLPCQFIRRSLAAFLHLENWDWISVFWGFTNTPEDSKSNARQWGTVNIGHSS